MPGANIRTYTDIDFWSDYTVYTSTTSIDFQEYYYHVASPMYAYITGGISLDYAQFNYVEYRASNGDSVTIGYFDFDVDTGHSYIFGTDVNWWDDGIEDDIHYMFTPNQIEFQVSLVDYESVLVTKTITVSGAF